MAERNDLNGWSIRAAGRYTGLTASAVQTLLRLDPEAPQEGPLSPIDVLCVRVLADLGANRSVNKAAKDPRTTRLTERDGHAIEVLRSAYAAGRIKWSTRLLAYDATASLAAKDFDVFAVMEGNPDAMLVVLPVGRWLEEIREQEATRAAARATESEKPVAETSAA